MTQASPNYYGQSRPELAAEVQPGARRVLDVGCGAGALAQELKKRLACCVVGIEGNPAMAQVAAERCNRVYVGDAEEVDLGAEDPFDCIIYGDVLEHLGDPWRTLSRHVQRLARGGRVIASLPNVRNARVIARLILKGEWEYAEYGILDRTHLRFFTRKSGCALFEGAGLRITAVRANREQLWFPLSLAPGPWLGDFNVVQWIFVATK